MTKQIINARDRRHLDRAYKVAGAVALSALIVGVILYFFIGLLGALLGGMWG